MDATEPSSQEPRAVLLAFLREEGYVPEPDADNAIRFKKEGWQFVLLLEPGDPGYILLLLPTIELFESDDDARDFVRALMAANRTTQEIKAAKVYVSIRDDDAVLVHVVVEQIAEGVEALLPLLDRYMRIAIQAANHFRQTYARFDEMSESRTETDG